MYLLLEYPPCSTCKNAKKYLKEHKISYQTRNIKEDNPTKEEIKTWISTYKIEIKKLFNTSGLVYREFNLKEKLQGMTIDEKIEMLASNGMLIKRPILLSDDQIRIGFRLEEWRNL